MAKFSKRWKTTAQWACFLGGVALLAAAVRSVGAEKLAGVFPQFEIWHTVIFFLYPFFCAWDVASWKTLLPPGRETRLSFAQLFGVRLAGEAVNNVTPLLDIGGEPLKVSLLCRYGIPKEAAIRSVVDAKTSLLISEFLFIAAGVTLSFWLLALTQAWKIAFLSAAFCFLCFVTVVAVIREKKFGRSDMSRAIFYNLIGWTAASLEMILMFRLVGIAVTPAQAFTLEALLQLVRTAAFFIPASLGAQEAGLAMLAGFLGVDPLLGLAVSLLKRIRQLLWTAVGFLIWGAYTARQPAR